MCLDCLAGYFCQEKTINPIVCGSAALFCPPNSGSGQSADEGYYTTPLSAETTTKREGQAICEAGFACVGGEKTSCQAGVTFQIEQRQASCTARAICPADRYKIAYCAPTADTQCGVCNPGFASMGGSAMSCTECNGGGLYSDEVGASVCKTAPAGTKPTSNRQDIENCPAGTFSIGGRGTCTTCKEGTHSAEGSAGCSPCDQYMTFNENKQECECQESFVTKDDGKCTCRAGQTLVNGRCEESENGRFKPEGNTKSCKVCDKELIHGALETINGTDKNSSASCTCGKGKFHDPSHPTHDTPKESAGIAWTSTSLRASAVTLSD